jgi:uncharacterized OB-fold protein
LVPILGFIKGTDTFPIQKCAIFRKFKEAAALRGGRRFCMPHKRFQTCHAQGVIDAEIAEKGHIWTETIWHRSRRQVRNEDAIIV